ncbi:MAG: ubiquinol-cytochrome c reductase iron-sulfur subunit, partial [Nitrospinae bacterium]|nr:ubiquinol-cytochrome c reductase iron-sulfur subunit [Nitrospinota bacterium]
FKGTYFFFFFFHGGQYDLTGKVVAGPPPEPLPVIDYALSNGKIIVGKKSA